ncbi:MAG: hypothetical protein QME51_08310, partial [Planctomycetota bacterium]|nr:hypothetical protein [Planctomycetota bacterium]MDI6788360.1 hypothetical protein [Planctomycetota bacterium]
MRYLVLVIILLGLVITRNNVLFVHSADDEEKSKKEEEIGQLQKCADTFYDLEKNKVIRFACFVKCPEIFKVQQFRSRFILEKVDYEMIWEPDKPITVKPRSIPPYFDNPAKAEAELYSKFMTKSLEEIFNISNNPIKELAKWIDTLKKTDAY